MYVKVRVRAGMSKEEFRKIKDVHFEIDTKVKAEKNLANKRVIQMLAEHFKIPEGKVRIVNGHRHSSKLVHIDQIVY
jgi:uncharacterized protein YggU (UPF0235/DUF167 family)